MTPQTGAGTEEIAPRPVPAADPGVRAGSAATTTPPTAAGGPAGGIPEAGPVLEGTGPASERAALAGGARTGRVLEGARPVGPPAGGGEAPAGGHLHALAGAWTDAAAKLNGTGRHLEATRSWHLGSVLLARTLLGRARQLDECAAQLNAALGERT